MNKQSRTLETPSDSLFPKRSGEKITMDIILGAAVLIGGGLLLFIIGSMAMAIGEIIGETLRLFSLTSGDNRWGFLLIGLSAMVVFLGMCWIVGRVIRKQK